MKIRAEDFYKAIGAELEEYAGEVTEAVKTVLKRDAKECRAKIQDRAPRRTGQYKKSWKIRTAYDGPGGVRMIVYSTRYQLTHLLEHGHASNLGGRVDGIPHIGPAAEWVNRKLPADLEKAIEAIK